MRTRHFASFRDLADELQSSAGETFTHYWQNPSYRQSLPEPFRGWLPPGLDFPGRSGQSVAPKYLYRGEPGLFRSTLSSRGRIAEAGLLSSYELALLDELTAMARQVWLQRPATDPFRAIGWPQHYGFPTPCIDLTSDPGVALGFAAWSSVDPPPPRRTVFRIDFESIERKVYAPRGRSTPLAAACIEDIDCTRATRQHAWVIFRQGRRATRFNLQWSWHLWRHVERFTVDAADADDYLRPDLLDAQHDAFAPWPLALLRALKIVARGALPRRLAEWICRRIPLYEWTPLRVDYDDLRRGTRLRLLSPHEAKAYDGRDYRANPDRVIAELLTSDIPVPNGILFGLPTGGQPNTSRWFEPGDLCEIQWQTSIGGHGRFLPGWRQPLTFEWVALR